MDINATIIGQFITFAILVWFTMKYVWPPVLKTLHDREKKIAEGLEAAERGKRELELAENQSLSIIREARHKAAQLVEQAQLQSAQLIEDAQKKAKEEGLRIVDLAKGEIDREVAQTKEMLRKQVATLAVACAEKIIHRQLDASLHKDLLHELVVEI